MKPVPRSARVKKRFSAFFAEEGTPLAQGLTVDISDKGISLQGGMAYPAGTELKIVIRPADRPPIDLRGQVVWATTRTMGVRLRGTQPRYLELVATSVAAETARRGTAPTAADSPAPTPAGPRADPLPGAAAAVTPVVSRVVIPPPPPPKAPSPAPIAPIVSRAPGQPEPRAPRFEERLPVRIGTHPAKLDREGYLLNISRNGVSVTCSGTFPKGIRVAIAVTLPDESLARIDGTIIWSRAAQAPGVSTIGVQLLRTDSPFLQLVGAARQKA